MSRGCLANAIECPLVKRGDRWCLECGGDADLIGFRAGGGMHKATGVFIRDEGDGQALGKRGTVFELDFFRGFHGSRILG